MKERLNQDIIKILSENSDYITSDSLSKQLNVNEKTIRRRIETINSILDENVATIISKRGSGYQLKIYNQDEFNRIFDLSISDTKIDNPFNRRSLIYQYIAENNGLNRQEILDKFFISESTFLHDIQVLNDIGKHENFEIINEPKFGYLVVGDIYHIRNALLRFHFESGFVGAYRRERALIKKEFINGIKEVFKNEGYYVNKHSLDAIFNFSSVSTGFIKAGKLVDLSYYENVEKINQNFFNLASKLQKAISRVVHINFPIEETYFLAYFLKSSLPPEIIENNINDDHELVWANIQSNNVLIAIEELGFGNNYEHILSDLNLYFYSLALRINLNIQKRLKYYRNIEDDYQMAFDVSRKIFEYIEKIDNIDFSLEEIAYFSLIIHYFIFSNVKNEKKVIAVLPSDYTVARLFKRELSKFNNVDITYFDFNSIDENRITEEKFDYLIVPSDYDFKLKNIPTIHVSEILSNNEKHYLSQVFTFYNFEAIRNLLSNIKFFELNTIEEYKTYQNLNIIISDKGNVGFDEIDSNCPMILYVLKKNIQPKILIKNNIYMDLDIRKDLFRMSYKLMDDFHDDPNTFTLEKIKKKYHIY